MYYISAGAQVKKRDLNIMIPNRKCRIVASKGNVKMLIVTTHTTLHNNKIALTC